MAKYQPELQKMGAYYGVVNPFMHAFEVRGHLHEETPDHFVIAPDENPTYLVDLAKKEGAGASAAEEKPGGEEPTLTIAQSDVVRYGRLLPKYGTYYAIYFLVTGLHALHIIGGVIVMFYFLTIGSRLYKRNPEQLSNRIEVTGIFWHFVDLVWITVFPILYLT